MREIILLEKDIKRFWDKVNIKNIDECWEWKAAKSKDGYGQIRIKNRMEYANRISWIIANNQIPNNMLVLHSCDFPPCCNPNHLFLGTQADNMRDMIRKGRGGSWMMGGEQSPKAKLTWERVEIIRKDYSTGEFTQREIAEREGVRPHTISGIINEKIWRRKSKEIEDAT